MASDSAHGRTREITIRATEGSGLAFDITPDGRTIIFDLLGQLWSLPIDGGTAVALTNAISDTSDDSDPSISPDGKWIVFRSDRPQGRGLWLKSLVDGSLRPLTDSTYFPNYEHIDPSWSPDSRRVVYLARWQLRVRDVVSGEDSLIHVPGLPPYFNSMAWSADGTRMLATTALYPNRLFELDLVANRGAAFDSNPGTAWAPSYSPDGSRIAYLSWIPSTHVVELRVRRKGELGGRLIASRSDAFGSRVRWSRDGRSLYYSAGGKLWRASADGGLPVQIPFTATLTFARASYPHRAVRIASPGDSIDARGFSGLALAPDGRKYAMISLGRLWIADTGHRPRAVRSVPSTASGLSWSPDGTRVVWSAGRGGAENLFITEMQSGDTRQATDLPGSESLASWSPDGRSIAFVHWAKPASADAPWAPDTAGSRIRVIAADRSAPAQLSEARDLGRFEAHSLGHDRLSWNATSSAVLAFMPLVPVVNSDSAHAVWLGFDGTRQALGVSAYRPSFPQVGRDGSLTYVQDALLWRMSPAAREPRLLSRAAALYPSVASDGTVLFASEDGLRLLRPDGAEELIGWPLRARVPDAPAPLLIRNARIFDGSGAAPQGRHDILIEGGRIRQIEVPGRIKTRRGVAELDAAGRTVIPGLMDAHTHLHDPAILPAALYFGVMTVRDLGESLARIADERDAVLVGATPGARLIVSGLRFVPSPATGGLTGDVEWMPRDTATFERGFALLRSFGAEHAKMVWPSTFPSGAAFARLARARGFTVSGHCASPLLLVAAGISGQEHLDGQCDGRSHEVYDDRIQLYRAAGVWGVPTIYLHGAHAAAVRDTTAMHDPDIEPFLTPRLRLIMLGDEPTAFDSLLRVTQGDRARANTRRFHEAGLPIALGADAPEFPDAVHGELAELVSAGLTPSEALVAATSTAARVLGIDAHLGTIAIGKVADLVILDADPLVDIHNTRRIWRVIQGGWVVDRARLREVALHGN